MGQIKTKELSKLGYTDDRARSLVINILSKHFKHHPKPALLELLGRIKNDPAAYREDPVLGSIAGVTLIGGSVEEASAAYKDIEAVMRLQEELVQVEGKFLPRIVRMNKE